MSFACFVALFMVPTRIAAQYKEIDRVDNELAREGMKSLSEAKITVADLHDTSGTAADQGHYCL